MKIEGDMVKLSLVRILMVAVLETVIGSDCDSGSHKCTMLPRSSVSDSTHTHRHKAYHPEVSCAHPDKQVAVRVKYHVTQHTATASVWACPSVKRVQIQLSHVKGHFLHVPRGVTVTSCAGTNDTAIFTKGHKRKHITLGFSPMIYFPHSLRLNYSYSQHNYDVAEPEAGGENHTTPTGVTTNVPLKTTDCDSASHVRRLRSVSEDMAGDEPTEHNRDNSTDGHTVLHAPVWPAKDCGVTQTCIRFGREGCGHLECDYLLTYHVINMTMADMQLSARTTGWVAVGFSSDRYMGGGDDVIGCKRETHSPNEVVSMSLWNQGHSRPNIKENRLTLKGGRIQDEHIYCRLQRPLKYRKRLDDHDLDLSNDWYQLYAFGGIDGNGLILQHSKLPRVSQEKITMIRTRNSQYVWSGAASLLVAGHVVPVLLLVTVSFAVS